MDREPKSPYVVQLRPVTHPDRPRLYIISGPGSEKYAGKFFTKQEAEELVDDLVLASVGFKGFDIRDKIAAGINQGR